MTTSSSEYDYMDDIPQNDMSGCGLRMRSTIYAGHLCPS